MTGGNSMYRGLATRVERDLRSILPYNTPVHVRASANGCLDAWRGASRWSSLLRDDLSKFCITKKLYEECGPGYLVEYPLSNPFFPIIEDG